MTDPSPPGGSKVRGAGGAHRCVRPRWYDLGRQPAYTQVLFAFHQLGVLAAKDPTFEETEPFKTVLSGDTAAIAKLGIPELLKVITVTHSGMTVDAFRTTVREWITTARHPRYKPLYTDLVYLPMLEVMRYLRDNGYKTIIVTGGGQDFVRTYVERVYGIPRDQVVGSAAGTSVWQQRRRSARLLRCAQGKSKEARLVGRERKE